MLFSNFKLSGCLIDLSTLELLSTPIRLNFLLFNKSKVGKPTYPSPITDKVFFLSFNLYFKFFTIILLASPLP